MLPNDKTTDRIGHWRPNDSLYFHKKCHAKGDFQPGWNEPTYQYRETKLETVPKPRSSPTFTSSILGSKHYAYKNAPEGSVHSQSVHHAETTNQRVFHKTGYTDYVPRRDVPMSPTKPYRREPY